MDTEMEATTEFCGLGFRDLATKLENQMDKTAEENEKETRARNLQP